MDQVFITKEELTKIQEMNSDFTKAKMAIGDVELQKLNIVRHIEELKAEFTALEKSLIDKYENITIKDIFTADYGRTFHLIGPAGVLWHFTEVTSEVVEKK